MSWKDSGKTVAFYTLGCKVNQQETDSLRALFAVRGYAEVPFESAADAYIINTCTVTQVSDQKSRQAISRAHARNPEAAIAVVGCYAQRAPEELAQIPGVKVLVGTQHRAKLVDLLEGVQGQQNAVEEIAGTRAFEELPLPTAGADGRTRVQLKIQDGCDRFCSYCIIPYARGPVRSRPPEEIAKALREMGRRGVAEVVLTGIHLMSYGREDAQLPRLERIIRMAAETPGIGRVRLGSLDPAMVDCVFTGALAALPAGKLCRQFHLSLQSGSAEVLLRMKRRYTPAAYEAAAARLQEAFPGCAITTDVIAGFPGETAEEHAETLAFVRRLAFARMHVFPYSRREGTVAAGLPGQVPKAEKSRRAKELIALGEELERAYVLSRVGAAEQLLPEEAGEGYVEGYTDTYVRARVQGTFPVGELLPVRIMGAKGTLADAVPL